MKTMHWSRKLLVVSLLSFIGAFVTVGLLLLITSATRRGGRGAAAVSGRGAPSSRSANLLQNEATRVAEARRLGQARDRATVPLLGHYACRSRDPEFRLACVRSLGEIADETCVQPLSVVLENAETDLRTAAVQALARCPGERALQFLVGALNQADEAVRAAAVRVLGEKDERTAIEAVAGAVADEAVRVRLEAVRGLAGNVEEVSSRGLARAVRDLNPDVRLAAMKELAMRRDAVSAEAVTQALTNPDAAVRAVAQEGFARLGKDALASVGSLRGGDIQARTDAARTLAANRSLESAAALVRLLDDTGGRRYPADPVRRLREIVRDGLAALGPAVLPVLDREVIEGEASRAAEEATGEVLVRIGRPAAQPLVKEILRWKLYHDPEELAIWVRTLGEVGDASCAEALNRALSQDIPGMDRMVEEARAKIEARCGTKLPPAVPHAVAFHAPLEPVASLDIEQASAPVTRPATGIPEDGVVRIQLRDALVRSGGGRAPVEVELVRRAGQWEDPIWGLAATFNKRDHPGRVLAYRNDGRIRIRFEMMFQDDAWVKGGYGVYDAELEPGRDGMAGRFTGHFNWRPVQGSVTAECREGRVRARDALAVAPGEHPRLYFTRKDLPILRARARTEFGRRIVALFRERISAGKVEDWKGELDWVTTWVSGLDREIAQAFLAEVFEDPVHGRRAAKSLILRSRTPAYPGEHGERQGGPLAMWGFGYDMGHNFLEPAELTEVQTLLSGFYGFIRPEHGMMANMANFGAYVLPGTGILALLGEKGPLTLPEPPALMPVREVRPDGQTRPEGAPVNPYGAGMMKEWILAGPFDGAADADLLSGLGGPAAQPREGTPVAHGAALLRFARLPAEAIRHTPGLGTKPQVVTIPGAGAQSRTLLYAVLKVEKEEGAFFDVSHPMGFRRGTVWFNGHEIPNGSVLVLEPGLHRILADVTGPVFSPCFLPSDARFLMACGKRQEWLREQWAQAQRRNERGGEMSAIPLMLGMAERGARMTLRNNIESWKRSGAYRGGDELLQFLMAYQRVTGEPLARDHGLPVCEIPEIAWPGLDAADFCYTIHLVPREMRAAMAWEFNRRYLPDKLAPLSNRHLTALFVNYPMEVTPAPRGKSDKRLLVVDEKPRIMFQSPAEAGGISVSVSLDEKAASALLRSRPSSSSFRFAGRGHEWVLDSEPLRADGTPVYEAVVTVGDKPPGGVAAVTYREVSAEGWAVMGFDQGPAYGTPGGATVAAERHLAVDYSGLGGVKALVAVVDRVCARGPKTWTLPTGCAYLDMGTNTIGAERVTVSAPRYVDGIAVPARAGDSRREYVTTMAANGRPGLVAGTPNAFAIHNSRPERRSETETSVRGAIVAPARPRVEFRATPEKGARPVMLVSSDEETAEFFVVMTAQDGPAPQIRVEGKGLAAVVTVGGRDIRFRNGRLVLSAAGSPP